MVPAKIVRDFLLALMSTWPEAAPSGASPGTRKKKKGGAGKDAGSGSVGAVFHCFAHGVDSLVMLAKLLHKDLIGGQR